MHSWLARDRAPTPFRGGEGMPHDKKKRKDKGMQSFSLSPPVTDIANSLPNLLS